MTAGPCWSDFPHVSQINKDRSFRSRIKRRIALGVCVADHRGDRVNCAEIRAIRIHYSNTSTDGAGVAGRVLRGGVFHSYLHHRPEPTPTREGFRALPHALAPNPKTGHPQVPIWAGQFGLGAVVHVAVGLLHGTLEGLEVAADVKSVHEGVVSLDTERHHHGPVAFVELSPGETRDRINRNR